MKPQVANKISWPN